MKVLSVTPDGEAKVEFTNLFTHTNVIGQTKNIQAMIAISAIPGLIRMEQSGRRHAQKFGSMLKKLNKRTKNS